MNFLSQYPFETITAICILVAAVGCYVICWVKGGK